MAGLVVGRRLGVYEIRSLIGAAAWERFIRARSPTGPRRRHQGPARPVVADPERRAEIEREARLLASLNHPDIGAIYGVEQADGVSRTRARIGGRSDARRAADQGRRFRCRRH